MGISCKPMGKNKSIMTKLENQLQKEAETKKTESKQVKKEEK